MTYKGRHPLLNEKNFKLPIWEDCVCVLKGQYHEINYFMNVYKLICVHISNISE
jgi:hypothetical protein